MAETTVQPLFTSKELVTDQDVRWCPGCGDYSILKQVQTVIPELGIPREQIVFISGIGCSSRFPYYMETYGMHSIHGRATAIASGLRATRPDLNIWIVTGDGDLLRRNFNVNILLFNNEIYGLTKGQYSPTSEKGKVTKSTPFGSVAHPFNPIALALGAEGTFVARSMDRDPVHLKEMLRRSNEHQGTSFLEIYQNCNVFNDGAFELFTDKGTKKIETLFVENGKPLIFGSENDKGIKLDGFKPVVVNLSEGHSPDDLWIHDERDLVKAGMLSRFFESPKANQHLFPRPFGVFFTDERPCYEEAMNFQVEHSVKNKGKGDLGKLIMGNETWEIH